MRKTISIFIISASIILAGSNCSNSQTVETEQILNVTPEILDFGEEGGTAHITVESTSKWYLQIPEEDNWCHCSLNEQENNTVEIKADANTTEQQRSTQILFSSGKLEKMVKESITTSREKDTNRRMEARNIHEPFFLADRSRLGNSKQIYEPIQIRLYRTFQPRY